MRLILGFISLVLIVACAEDKAQELKYSSEAGIVGGKDLQSTDLLSKFIVGVWDQKYESLCTGTLITENIVLTAAHCILSHPNQIKIIFGTNAFLTLNAREVDIQKEFVRKVVSVKVHEGYEKNPEKESPIDQNDIAVVKFSGSLPEGYQPAKLLESESELSQGVEATVAGYGVSKVEVTDIDIKSYSQKKLIEGMEDGSIACDEQMTECYLVEMSGDGYLRSAKAKIEGFTETEVRLDESKGQGTCSGDSGGPAFIEKDGNYFLWGITSRGNLMCDREGIYTNAVEHGAWLKAALSALQ